MASRLYKEPGPRGQFQETYSVFSLTKLGRPDLEYGDKIIMPSESFKEILYLKLQFPLFFECKNPKKPRMNQKKEVPQYCGVLEFSSEDGNVYLPQWMMQNLQVKDGHKVGFTSIAAVPQGQYCKLQPHKTSFVNAMAEMGPRHLLESAMRGYSVLSAGERLLIECGGEAHAVTVVETRPAACVSILGCLDLEVDFAPPLDDPTALAEAAVASAASSSSSSSSSTSPASASAGASSGPQAAAKPGAGATAGAKKPGSSSSSKPAPGAKPTGTNSSAAAAAAKKPNGSSSSSSGNQDSAQKQLVAAAVSAADFGDAFGDGSDAFGGNSSTSAAFGVSNFASATSAFSLPVPSSSSSSASLSASAASVNRSTSLPTSSSSSFPRSTSPANVPASSTSSSASSSSSSSANPSIRPLPARRYLAQVHSAVADQYNKQQSAMPPAPPSLVSSTSSSLASADEEQDASIPAGTVSTSPSTGESVTLCGNCRKWIGTPNYAMHSLHCARNVTRCAQCQMLVKRSEMAAHVQSVHQLTACPSCSEQLPPFQLSYHSTYLCPQRLMVCIWCGRADLVAKDYDRHRKTCGDTKEKCDACATEYPRRDYDAHECQPRCVCKQSVPADRWEQHQFQECPMRKNSCPYCKLPVSVADSEAHLARCGARTEPCSICSRFIRLRDMAQHEDSLCTYPPIEVPKPPPPAAAANKQDDVAAADEEMLAAALAASAGDGDASAPIEDVPPLEYLTCPLCGEPFAMMEEAHEHVLLRHAPSPEDASSEDAEILRRVTVELDAVDGALARLSAQDAERVERRQKHVDKAARQAALKAAAAATKAGSASSANSNGKNGASNGKPIAAGRNGAAAASAANNKKGAPAPNPSMNRQSSLAATGSSAPTASRRPVNGSSSSSSSSSAPNSNPSSASSSRSSSASAHPPRVPSASRSRVVVTAPKLPSASASVNGKPSSGPSATGKSGTLPRAGSQVPKGVPRLGSTGSRNADQESPEEAMLRAAIAASLATATAEAESRNKPSEFSSAASLSSSSAPLSARPFSARPGSARPGSARSSAGVHALMAMRDAAASGQDDDDAFGGDL